MKNVLKFSFALLVSVLICTSCTKHGSESSTTQYLTLTSAAIDSFSTTGTMLAVAGAAGSKIEITASASSGATVYLWINPYPATTGTFSLNGINNGIEFDARDTLITSAHGTLTVTSVTPHIIGTFTFTGTDSAAFTGTVDVIAP